MSKSMMEFKRGREEEVEALAMANCLMLISRVGEKGLSDGRVFTCKTCHRQFPTFQALGGHRASHGKEKEKMEEMKINNLGKKKKMHACSICGQNFLTGQSLGGHMRRHRPAANELTTAESDGSRSTVAEEDDQKRIMRMRVDLNLTPLQNYLRLGNASFVMGLV